jgi:hypothetical protein
VQAVPERPVALKGALRLDPQFIVIAADPSLSLPAELAIAAAEAALELVKNEVGEQLLLVQRELDRRNGGLVMTGCMAAPASMPGMVWGWSGAAGVCAAAAVANKAKAAASGEIRRALMARAPPGTCRSLGGRADDNGRPSGPGCRR